MTTGRTDSCSFRTPLRRRDGGTLPEQLRLQPISEDGKVRVLATIDFSPGGTEAQAGHLLNAALLRSVIETAPDAILIIEPDGRIDSFRPAAEKLFGYTPNEVLGHNVNMLMPEPYRSQHDGYIARYLATGEKHIIGIGRTVMARHKDGRTFPIELAVGEVKSGASHVFTAFSLAAASRAAAAPVLAPKRPIGGSARTGSARAQRIASTTRKPSSGMSKTLARLEASSSVRRSNSRLASPRSASWSATGCCAGSIDCCRHRARRQRGRAARRAGGECRRVAPAPPLRSVFRGPHPSSLTP